MSMIDLLAESVWQNQRRSAAIVAGRRCVSQQPQAEMTQSVTLNDSIDRQFLVLHKRRKNYRLCGLWVEFEPYFSEMASN
ncbi:MAG: hypothetical protein R3C26_22105 [Calditrichia bacterium]